MSERIKRIEIPISYPYWGLEVLPVEQFSQNGGKEHQVPPGTTVNIRGVADAKRTRFDLGNLTLGIGLRVRNFVIGRNLYPPTEGAVVAYFDHDLLRIEAEANRRREEYESLRSKFSALKLTPPEAWVLASSPVDMFYLQQGSDFKPSLTFAEEFKRASLEARDITRLSIAVILSENPQTFPLPPNSREFRYVKG